MCMVTHIRCAFFAGMALFFVASCDTDAFRPPPLAGVWLYDASYPDTRGGRVEAWTRLDITMQAENQGTGSCRFKQPDKVEAQDCRIEVRYEYPKVFLRLLWPTGGTISAGELYMDSGGRLMRIVLSSDEGYVRQ